MASILGNLVALALAPLLLVGVVNRVKSLWVGRRGPSIVQPVHDVVRLLRKRQVHGATTTPIFRIAPWIHLATAIGSALVVPVLGGRSVLAFPGDFVWFAYVGGLGRMAVMLAAMDTGSSFEGMGASREATFSALLEPALFLLAGALFLVTGASTFSEALTRSASMGGVAVVVRAVAAAGLLVVLQVEAKRLPVDDPATHLELTMVHEVMVLDHAGPDLAAIQMAAAIKLFVGSTLVVTLVHPWAGGTGAAPALATLAGCGVVAVVIGTVESVVARLRMRAVPGYVVVALVAGSVAVLATSWSPGVTR